MREVLTGKELQKIRQNICGDDLAHFGRMLGVAENNPNYTIARSVARLEARDIVHAWNSRLACIFRDHPSIAKEYFDRYKENPWVHESSSRTAGVEYIRSNGWVVTIANKLGLSRQAVFQWRRIPPDYVKKVAKITGKSEKFLEE